jgi:hypothetical protein
VSILVADSASDLRLAQRPLVPRATTESDVALYLNRRLHSQGVHDLNVFSTSIALSRVPLRQVQGACLLSEGVDSAFADVGGPAALGV